VPKQNSVKRKIVDLASLPPKYPTHLHHANFWESLGRTVATFGFLEEILAKAIFAFTATKEYQEHETDAAFVKWLPILEHALTDQLGKLIGSYEKAVKGNTNSTIINLGELVEDLRKAAEIRNVLCHGSWRPADITGKSIPLFVDRDKKIFNTAIDVEFLNQTQRHIAELACAVVSTVEHMGWQFPGSTGSGKTIWNHKP
jgi:kynureninase